MNTTPGTAANSDARKRNAEMAGQPPTLPDVPIPGPREAAELIWFHLAHAPSVSHEDRARLNAYARDVYDRSVAKVDPTPPTAPEPVWAVISEDRENPTLAKVTWAVRGGKTSTGMYYRDDFGIYDEWRDGIGRLDSVESVEVLHTYDPVTHVPVERALIDEYEAFVDRAKDIVKYQTLGHDVPIVQDLAALADGAEA